MQKTCSTHDDDKCSSTLDTYESGMLLGLSAVFTVRVIIAT